MVRLVAWIVSLNACSRPHLISYQIVKLPLAQVDPRQVFDRRHILHTLLCLVVRNLECNVGLVLVLPRPLPEHKTENRGVLPIAPCAASPAPPLSSNQRLAKLPSPI